MIKITRHHNYAILLAGGQGSRFWPQSRTLEPKQFLALDKKDKSLFIQAILRIKSLISCSNIFIATSELYRDQIIKLIEPFKIPVDNLIFEPAGKNTAPCIAITAALIHNRDQEARICVLPCDHLIKNNSKFKQLLLNGLEICRGDNLVIFGIPPTRPATGYGYIKVKPQPLPNSLTKQVNNPVFLVNQFCEKPALKTAKKFFKNSAYYWNSGIFVGSSKAFLDEFKNNLPELYKLIKKINNPNDLKLIWKKIQPVSFDCGILEKTRAILMLAADNLGWSDLGSWQAWDELLKKDEQGNIFKADVVNLNSKNITVVGGNRLIATIGLEDLIVVDTPDALLITKKNRAEDVKKIVDILKTQKRQEYYTHKTVQRPWGNFTTLEIGEGFKVKLVEVKPGKALSLQYHQKRSEHWVVVEGKAKIIKNKRGFIFEANQSTYIPIGCVHRLMNPLKDKVLKIIEVQAGKYLQEDDIIRLKDEFGRCSA